MLSLSLSLSLPTHKADLVMWRKRMAAQFEAEQRGPTWVQGGVLQRRVQGQLYSPNYPTGV